MSNKDFDFTPSFFNNEESFEKYLGKTSYYLDLQKNVCTLIELANSKNIVELGSATGATSIMIAKKFSNAKVVGVDMRKDVVEIANGLAKKSNIENVDFKQGDMTLFVKNKLESDFVLLLYSFHHIVDPIDNKINFLKDLYNSIKKNTYVCIAETFIPDTAIGLYDKEKILELWSIRKNEGYVSTFWGSLSGLSEQDIQHAIDVGNYCANNEYLAGNLVAQRNEEYLVQPSWLINQVKSIGFKIVLNQPINIIEDRIILLKK